MQNHLKLWPVVTALREGSQGDSSFTIRPLFIMKLLLTLLLTLSLLSCSKGKTEKNCKTCTAISQGQTFTQKDCDGLPERDAQGNYLNWVCR